MPKLKTKKSAAKRFRITKGGKIKHAKAYRRHIMTSKTAKRKRQLRKGQLVDQADVARVKELLPYG